jgi:hypothetical protein
MAEVHYCSPLSLKHMLYQLLKTAHYHALVQPLELIITPFHLKSAVN